MSTFNYANAMARASAWLADALIRNRVAMLIVLSC